MSLLSRLYTHLRYFNLLILNRVKDEDVDKVTSVTPTPKKVTSVTLPPSLRLCRGLLLTKDLLC